MKGMKTAKAPKAKSLENTGNKPGLFGMQPKFKSWTGSHKALKFPKGR